MGRFALEVGRASLERFCELSRLYAVPPPARLADIWRSTPDTNAVSVPSQETPEPEIDLRFLESLGSAEAILVGFIRQIRRGEPSKTIVLRAGDLEVLATPRAKAC